MRNKELRRRCEGVVSDLPIPDPFDIFEMCRLLGEQRGRPIHLTPIALPADTPCGLIVCTDNFDAIFYQGNTSPFHQELIIGHEVGHLVGGHQSISAEQDLGAELSATLLPNVDPRLIRRVLGRTGYEEMEEREAELIASLISRAAHRPQPASNWVAPPQYAADFDRIAEGLEDNHTRGRAHG